MSNGEPDYGYSGSSEEEDDLLERASGKLPVDYEGRLDSLKKLKNTSISMYYSMINEIISMANGGNDGGVREIKYKKWTNRCFCKLLEDLGEK